MHGIVIAIYLLRFSLVMVIPITPDHPLLACSEQHQLTKYQRFFRGRGAFGGTIYQLLWVLWPDSHFQELLLNALCSL